MTPSIRSAGRVVHQTETSCCCGHGAEFHLGGPDLDLTGVEVLRRKQPHGDGGMCRVHVEGGRCSCFNFCDCHLVKS